MGLLKEESVCVTGGTGYISSCLIRRLLQDGYNVRTTVRNSQDTKKTAFLWELEGAKERLSIFEADLMREGSFDAAVEGVRGVFHSAGPVIPSPATGDPHVDLIDPSLKGTLNVLRACLRSSTFQRVVMTSSCSAIRYNYNRTTNDPPLDETSWSDIEFCKNHKMWYPLAKTLAEKEAWKFAAEHNLELVVVNASYVVGPFLGPFPTSTASNVLYLLQGKAEEYPNQIIGFVHVDDVVAAHILVYEKADANGRYICSSVVAHWREILSMIQNKYPKLKIPTRCGEHDTEAIPHNINTNKVQQLGLATFKSVERMFDDCIHDLTKKGLLPQLLAL